MLPAVGGGGQREGSRSKWGRRPRKTEPGLPEHSESVSHSEHCEEAYGVLLTLREADSGAREGAPLSDLEVAEKEARRLLAEEEAAVDGGTPGNPQPRYPCESRELGGPVSGCCIREWGSHRRLWVGVWHGRTQQSWRRALCGWLA